jgi:predicted regulator of Ras-like GTPase activity (Roadblock/LC7/MglB family)
MLRPATVVMLIDDDLSAKSAIAALRLGACDYFHKPLNMHFLLMQIERQFAWRQFEQSPGTRDKMDSSEVRREQLLNLETRAASLMVSRAQFAAINYELQRLMAQIKADFAGLLDGEGNLVGAAGSVEECDMVLLTRALTIDHNATHALAAILQEEQFHNTYLEGEHNGVYIVEIARPYVFSLALICSSDIKPGMVWLYIKRAAEDIMALLDTTPSTDLRNRFTT